MSENEAVVDRMGSVADFPFLVYVHQTFNYKTFQMFRLYQRSFSLNCFSTTVEGVFLVPQRGLIGYRYIRENNIVS